MADKQELEVQQKREVDTSRESTRPTRAFVPVPTSTKAKMP